MSAVSVNPSFPIFTDIDGQPLEDGNIFIGTAGLNPIANPISAYWDAALTQVATQPVRTRGGYPINNGVLGMLYVNSDYSLTVQNKNGSTVSSSLVATSKYGNLISFSDITGTLGSDRVTFLQAGTGATSRTAQAKLRDVVSVKDFGAVGDGVADDTAAIQAAIDAVGMAGGGVIDGSGLIYCVDSANGCVVNYDNVLLQNFTFKRTNAANTGYTLRFATTTNTSGGGVINARFIGIPTVAAMAGLLMGSATLKANNYILENIESIQHGQYGVAIEAGDNWKISNIRVLDHGLTTGSISSCIGFYIYPKIASSGGQLNNVSAQISDACVANTSANTAALKLQTHQRLTATNIRAVYGSEQAMAIDSVNGIIRNVYVRQQGANAGLVVGNYNPAHSFSGQTFTLDGFVTEAGNLGTNNDFLIGGGEDGQYKLTECTIRNGTGESAGFLALSNCRDCTFENLDFKDIRFSAAYRGYAVNSLPSVGNTLRNVSVKGGASLTGVLAIETSDSVLLNCGGSAINGDTVSNFDLYGSNNIVISPFMRNAAGNAIKVTGSNNDFFDVALKDIGNRSIWFPAGSDNNRVHSGDLYVGNGVLNSGSGNYLNGYKKVQYGSAAPTTGTWAQGDIVYALSPAAGGYLGWICTTAGTPGTWKQFGAILP